VWWRRKPADARDGAKTSEPTALTTAGEFESADALDKDAPPADEIMGHMEQALERLRGEHLAFRPTERCEDCGLEELRLQILTAVTKSDELESYYREAWGLAPGDSPGIESEPKAGYRSVAVLQIELMVRAFHVLQLQLFANAPENRGWMTLFRSWGRSPRFNRVFKELAATLEPEFTRFYELYLRDLPPLASASGHLPIHHPWLPPASARGRGLFMDSGRGEPEVESRDTDQKSGEGADRGHEQPSDSADQGGGPPPAPNE
jgi:hypothetical protein